MLLAPAFQQEVELDMLEHDRLRTCEGVIRDGIAKFYAVGNALAEIRDKRLYRASYITFEAYCRQRWGMAVRTAHQTIASAGVVAMLGDCPVLPQRESLARELVGLPPEEAKAVWLRAISECKTVTAEQLRRFLSKQSHARQVIPTVADTTCPQCQYSFRTYRPESASRGSRVPSKGVEWALSILPKLSVACDYGCGRFRNAPQLNGIFDRVIYTDTSTQCARVLSLANDMEMLNVDEMGEVDGQIDVVFLVAVLHILPNVAARRLVARKIAGLDAEWLVIETPRSQPYYKGKLKRGHFFSREGTHYWDLTDRQVTSLFPGYNLVRRRRIRHNVCAIFQRMHK